jgi:hypothetical protein
MTNEMNTTTKDLIKYRFTVISKVNNNKIGTGLLTANQKISQNEQISLFHKVTNGIYLKEFNVLNIEIFKSNE